MLVINRTAAPVPSVYLYLDNPHAQVESTCCVIVLSCLEWVKIAVKTIHTILMCIQPVGYSRILSMELSWKQRFETELAQAETARAAGNEGRARVCARRAAGLAAEEYFNRRGLPQMGPSAYDHLRSLRDLPDLDDHVRQKVDHFLVRVTPEYTLPVPADLVAEARWLAQALLSDAEHP
jgi:hypothetical protein